VLERPADARPDCLGGVDEVRRCDGLLRAASGVAAAQEVDALIVRDAEEPGSQRPAVVVRVESAVGLEQRILHHVFAVEHRTGHPGAVAVQLRPQIADGLEEGEVPSLEHAGACRARVRNRVRFHNP